jgi:hypothetical protein
LTSLALRFCLSLQLSPWITHHVRVVQRSVEDRSGKHLVAEDRPPLRHELIGGDERARALVASRDGLEEVASLRASFSSIDGWNLKSNSSSVLMAGKCAEGAGDPFSPVVLPLGQEGLHVDGDEDAGAGGDARRSPRRRASVKVPARGPGAPVLSASFILRDLSAQPAPTMSHSHFTAPRRGSWGACGIDASDHPMRHYELSNAIVAQDHFAAIRLVGVADLGLPVAVAAYAASQTRAR